MTNDILLILLAIVRQSCYIRRAVKYWGCYRILGGIRVQGKVHIMVSQKVVIKNPTGLHLRPAGILCKEAMRFNSLITFTFRDNTANAKSVLSVLGACVKCGDEIEFVCEGEDEQEALNTLIRAVESGLGE